MRFINSIFTVFGAVIFYFVFYTLLKSVLPILPDLTLYRQLDLTFDIYNYSVPMFDMLFFTFGLWVFCHGVIRLASLSEKGHLSSLDDLNDGEFGKIRHPLYGAFMIIELGLFISLRTLYGLIFLMALIFFQIIASYVEDTYVLKKRFGERYEEYCTLVKRRFFTTPMLFYYICAVVLIGGGVYYMFNW